MKEFFKPASIAFYFLTLLVFFLLGLFYAGLIDAGKNQGLAGGAIVLGWGVLFGGIAFLIALFVGFRIRHKLLVKLNWTLLATLLITYGFAHYRFKSKQKEKNEQEEIQTKPTSPTSDVMALLYTSEVNEGKKEVFRNDKTPMGLGFFIPNFHNNQTLYFYGNINMEKSVDDHSPHDSITFARNEYNQFEIKTAPPWLVPDLLKLDYDMLYFRVYSVGRDFIEVIGNTTTNLKTFVSRYSGRMVYWPEFLLGVHSVEFIPGNEQHVKVKPLENASLNSTQYEFMRPIIIEQEWMQVELLDSDFKTVGKGWVKWQANGELLVSYNLLS